MPQRTYAIGRGPEAPIRITDSERTVSTVHAEITVTEDGRYYLTDRDSTNGTSVFRRGAWRTVRQDFVDPHERIRLGGYETTAHQLIGTLSDRPLPVAKPRPEAPQSPKQVAGERRPRRNPETGEIIED